MKTQATQVSGGKAGRENKCETEVGACLPDQRDGREAGVAAGEGTLGSTVGNISRTGWWVPSA